MISWIASGIILIGNIVLIRSKSWKTFILFMIGNALFAYDWYVKKEWAVFILVNIFILQNIWGIISWRKNDGK